MERTLMNCSEMAMFKLICILCVLYSCYIGDSMATLTITSWNMRCMYSSAGPYIKELATVSDIVALSEHGLFPCEIYKFGNEFPDYECLAKSSSNITDRDFGNRNGIGGCAILWHKCSKRTK